MVTISSSFYRNSTDQCRLVTTNEGKDRSTSNVKSLTYNKHAGPRDSNRRSAVLVAGMAPETGLIGELAGTVCTLECLDVVVGVHVPFIVPPEVEAFPADPTGVWRAVQVHFINVSS